METVTASGVRHLAFLLDTNPLGIINLILPHVAQRFINHREASKQVETSFLRIKCKSRSTSLTGKLMSVRVTRRCVLVKNRDDSCVYID